MLAVASLGAAEGFAMAGDGALTVGYEPWAAQIRTLIETTSEVTHIELRTRRMNPLRSIFDLFLARHIELHSVSESLDTSTPHGRFVLTLFGGLAQMERELIGERTRSALAFKRENGQPPG